MSGFSRGWIAERSCKRPGKLVKGYFPRNFNTSENAKYIRPWPDTYFYGLALMKADKRDAFYIWYSQQSGKVFNLEEELLRYCRSDVYVLMAGCLRFEEMFSTRQV